MTDTAADTQAKPWFSEEFLDLPDQHFDIEGGQRASMRPRFLINGYRRVPPGGSLDKDLQWLVRVDCNNSSVHPGSLCWDQEDKRGYFTHAVKVRIWFRDEDGYTCSWGVPASTREGGSSSASRSTSYSAGFFDISPTASYSGSISSGVTQTFPDFEIFNNEGISDNHVAEQIYKLRLVNDGHYLKPLDMLDDSVYKHRVRNLCPAAISRFDIVSGALFAKSHANHISAVGRLSIEFTYTLMSIEKTWTSEFWLPLMAAHRFVFPDNNSDVDAQTTWKAIFGGKILVDSNPVVKKFSWSFDVDMKNGKVTQNA